MTHRTIAGVVIALALAIAGCGDDDDATSTTGSSSSAVESAVARAIDSQLSEPPVEVTGVRCPGDVKPGAGATVTCEVSWNNGATGKAEVTPKSLTNIAFEVVPGSVTVPRETVELAVEQELATDGAQTPGVTCPATMTVKLDTPVTCEVDGAGGTVSFEFSDETGTVDPQSVKTA